MSVLTKTVEVVSVVSLEGVVAGEGLEHVLLVVLSLYVGLVVHPGPQLPLHHQEHLPAGESVASAHDRSHC